MPSTERINQIEALGPWYHTITLSDGFETPGKGVNVATAFESMEPYLSSDLTGLTVLDVGCNAGGLTFEFAKRGAQCRGIEFSNTYFRQAKFCAEDLGLADRCHFERGDIYSLIKDSTEYDVVLFMGLIYHLRYPQLAIDLLSERCRGRMFMNTPTVMPQDEPVAEFRVPADARPHRLLEYPKFNLWYCSMETLRRMMRLGGFAEIESVWHKEDPFVSSSPHVDNATYLQTGQGLLTGTRDRDFAPCAASELWSYASSE